MPADPLWALLAPLVSPWPLVFAQQNAAPPPKPYAAVDVRSVVPLGTILGDPAADGSMSIAGPVLLRVEVNLYGPGCDEKARMAALMLRHPVTAQAGAALNLGVARVVGITGATAFADQPQYEERTILELTVNATDGALIAGYSAGNPTGGSNIEHVVIELDPTISPPPGSVLDDGWVTCGGQTSAANATTPPPAP